MVPEGLAGMEDMKPFVIGQGSRAVYPESRVLAAPMAGVTDSGYRRILRSFGAALTYTEMVSAKGLHYRNENTRFLLEHSAQEEPIFVQLFGSDPEILKEAAMMLENDFAGIDINMGCPAPKIVSNHEGSALMDRPELVYDIVRSVRSGVKVPVTVKIRKGRRKTDNQAVEVALAAQEAGADAMTVHGRTAEQMYSGSCDLTVIREVKEKLSIPVIGNGDVKDASSALRMINETGCDAVMVGRACQGNPWVFSQIVHALKGEQVPPAPSPEEIIRLCLYHAELEVEHKGEYTAMREMRPHIMSYLKGQKDAARKKRQLMQVTTLQDLKELLSD